MCYQNDQYMKFKDIDEKNINKCPSICNILMINKIYSFKMVGHYLYAYYNFKSTILGIKLWGIVEHLDYFGTLYA